MCRVQRNLSFSFFILVRLFLFQSIVQQVLKLPRQFNLEHLVEKKNIFNSFTKIKRFSFLSF